MMATDLLFSFVMCHEIVVFGKVLKVCCYLVVYDAQFFSVGECMRPSVLKSVQNLSCVVYFSHYGAM